MRFAEAHSDKSGKLMAQANRLESEMSNGRGRSSNLSTFSSSSSSSSSRNAFSLPVKHLDGVCNRYSQQLACDLQTTKETAAETRCRDNPFMFIVDQPQTMLRICPGQNVHLSHIDEDADNEKQNDIERERGDAGAMADDSGSRPLSTRVANIFTTTVRPTLASETSRNGDTPVPASDIFNYSLSDFIASVTIPPPPPPPHRHLTSPLLLPLPPPPPQQATELFLETAKKQLGNANSKQNFLESLSLAADRDRYNLTTADAPLLVVPSLEDGTTFTSVKRRSDDRSSSGAPVDPRRESSRSLPVPSSEIDDFSKLVIPPPPLDASIHDSMSKLRESRNGEDLLLRAPISNSIIVQVPTPVTPPRSPASLSISRLPPLHPSKSQIAGRSPSLSPRAMSANSAAVSRSSFPQSPHFGDVPSPAATEQRILVEGNVCAKTRRSESTDLNQSSVQSSDKVDVALHENSKNTVDDSEASPMTHSSILSYAKATPPVPPPRRLNSSVNSSPAVVRRPERRVSFGVCPPSTKYLPFDGDADNHYQAQGNERAELGFSRTSSFAQRLDFSADSIGDLGQPASTAQIRPSALRTSGSMGFHGVLLEDASFAAADDVGRISRSGSVSGSSSSASKAGASVFAAIRSRLKSYWSPSMPRGRTSPRENDQSNRPSSAGWPSTASFDFEQESSSGGDDHRGRYNSRRAGNSNKNRFSLVIDSTLDAEEGNSIEFYLEKKPSVPNALNSFTGQ